MKNKNRNIRIAVLPSSRKSYTLQKAPMAHKTNSKEQFLMKFYYFKVSFAGEVVESVNLNSVNKGFYFFFILNKFFPVFDTNLMFLKYYRVTFNVCDRQFFNYHGVRSGNYLKN